ncbi:MAG: leucine-rich repeat protein, partial [Akkermansiaceae bacterium]|nr:leucine-rich repeat protein [Akkermansiaceae bacterium]
MRTWTSDIGTKIEAELVSLADGKVTLKTKTGRTLKVPLHKLSKADQEFAAAKLSPKEPTKDAVSVNPNLKYEVKGDEVTITGCDKKASGELIIAAIIEGKPVTSIGKRAFLQCSSLTSITIPDSVTSIGNYAFGGCDRLTSITIPDSVISIGTALFAGCRSLKSITIGNSVTSIGDGAFSNCTSLTSINIPNGVTSIGREAFGGCTNLTTIKVGAENLNYTDVEGVLFNKKKTLLHTYPAGKADANYAIPDRITSIREGRRYPMDQQIVNASREKIKRDFQGFMKVPKNMKGQFIDRSADLSLAFSDFYVENPFPPASGKLTQTGVN